MTGLYPHWWIGKKFNRPIKAWACGVTTGQIREAIQETLFGSFAEPGTGLIPRHTLLDEKGQLQIWNKPGGENCIGTCLINHVSGGKSKVEFKTYDQGWEKYQGAKRDLIWLDEEPQDRKIYEECATRTAGEVGEEGILYCTFTPLQGYSDVVLSYLPDGNMPVNGVHPEQPNKFVVCAGWEDVPHLSEEWKKQQLAEYSPSQRTARSKGIPSMGSGKIFPVDEDFIRCEPFKIPEYWPRVYGYDFGWKKTAAVWIAQDPVTKVKYLYAEYKQGEVADYVHAQCVKSKGSWIRGIADPSGGGRRDDGTLKIDYMRSLGLELIPGHNSLVVGIGKLLNQMESGLFKVFSTCENWFKEYRVYRYDLNDPNKPARDQDDHELDATRYADSRFDEVALSESDYDDMMRQMQFGDDLDLNKYKRDSLTGY